MCGREKLGLAYASLRRFEPVFRTKLYTFSTRFWIPGNRKWISSLFYVYFFAPAPVLPEALIRDLYECAGWGFNVDRRGGFRFAKRSIIHLMRWAQICALLRGSGDHIYAYNPVMNRGT